MILPLLRHRSLLILMALLVLALAKESGAAEGPRVQMREQGKAVEVEGLSATDLDRLRGWKETAKAWTRLFAVHVEQSGRQAGTDQPPVLGSYRIAGNALRFEPRFPLTAGVRYRAVLRPSFLPSRQGKTAQPIETTLSLPRRAGKATVVEQIYPSRSDLPENHLRFYIHFSEAVSQGDAYAYIRLLDERGKAIDNGFLELEPELWSGDGRRFTLLLDPGRIKRGLKPREDLGPVLQAGKRYTLVVDRSWPDSQGRPLGEGGRKSFTVTRPDETSPDPTRWKLQAPPAGSRAPVVVDLPESLDHALLHRLVWVTDDRGRRVPGTVAVSRQETRWQFTPTAAWTAGCYSLVADTRLEDLAGNSIGRPFEVDEERPIERSVPATTVSIPFTVRKR